MRIVCPRCVAQYEVDEAAIPESGREVQCANCDNIWFQDYIEMLPDRAVDSAEDFEDKGVFDNLDDLPELNFRSKRAQTAAPSAQQDTVTADDSDEGEAIARTEDSTAPAAPHYSASEDDYDDGDYDDDDAPSPNLRAAPVAEDVLNVLRSEAAFSSASAARDKLDAATADAIDGDGEERKIAVDRALAQADDEQETRLESGSDPQDQEKPDFDEETPLEDAAADDLAADHDPEDAHDRSGLATDDAQAEVAEDALAKDDTAEVDDLGFEGLTEFLDAHAGEEQESDTDKDALQPDPSAPEPQDAADATAEDAEADPDFDPLADLEAIRSQLETIGAHRSAEAEQDPDTVAEDDAEQYTPILPSDDPLPEDTDEELRNPYASDDSLDTEDDLTEDLSLAEIDEDDAPSDMLAALRVDAEEDGIGDDKSDFDDLEEDRARHAYRADSTGPLSKEHAEEKDDAPEDDDGIPKGGIAAAAIMGLSRPKARTGRGRARVKQGFGLDGETDKAALSPLEEGELELADETASGQAGRKSLLPDVDELDASLRSDAGQPRRRDREMREAHEEELARKSGGFRRAFVWTVFIFAILIALYLLHPLIVAGMPAAAVVLDPYASAIDSLRLMIERMIGG